MNKLEFRIDNKILIGTSVCRITELYNDEFRTPEHGFCSYDHPQLSGIPITEEWLLKFGFEYCNDEKFNEYANAKMFFKDSIQVGSHRIEDRGHIVKHPTFLGGYPINAIDYVHQLQNLFYVIVGKELVASI